MKHDVAAADVGNDERPPMSHNGDRSSIVIQMKTSDPSIRPDQVTRRVE